MREDPLWARIALLLNLGGTILLALSFQATSSTFRFLAIQGMGVRENIDSSSTLYAICVDSHMLAETDSHNSFRAGSISCPDQTNSSHAAIVTAEHPIFLYVGLGLSGCGFFFQFLIIPRRRTLAEVNEEMRLLRKTRKLLEIKEAPKS